MRVQSARVGRGTNKPATTMVFHESNISCSLSLVVYYRPVNIEQANYLASPSTYVIKEVIKHLIIILILHLMIEAARCNYSTTYNH